MIIGLDVDGVLRDFVGQLTKQFEVDFPEAAHLVLPVTHWELEKSYPLPAPYFRRWWEWIRGEEIMSKAEPYPGAIPFASSLWSIVNDGENKHELWVVSHQAPHLEPATIDWLEFFEIWYHKIVFTADKHNIGLTHLIDDSTHVLEKFPKEGAFCLRRPWNSDYSGERLTYGEIIDKIKNRTGW